MTLPDISATVAHDGLTPDDDLSGLGVGAAHEWSLWSMAVGRSVVPIFEDLRSRLTSLTSAMLCTVDGFNVCTIGVDEESVGRLAALASSLHSVSSAATAVIQGDGTEMDVVSIAAGTSLSVVAAIPDPAVGHLLLWVSADKVTLGVLLVHVRGAAEQIRQLLAVH